MANQLYYYRSKAIVGFHLEDVSMARSRGQLTGGTSGYVIDRPKRRQPPESQTVVGLMPNSVQKALNNELLVELEAEASLFKSPSL